MPGSFEEHCWRLCAEEARKLADEMSDPLSKQMLHIIAIEHDQFAEEAAVRRSSSSATGVL